MASLNRDLSDTPVAILDFETTGYSPKNGCRVVEVAIVRVEPGQVPQLVLDTLVDPEGPVQASRIHGITDDDVLGAPPFSDLAGSIAASVEDAVVGCFNASFDMQFWESEFARLPEKYWVPQPPHVCLMYMRPLLGLGGKCCLGDACSQQGISGATHRAADDALATAYLWLSYRARALADGISTFGDLAERGTYRFLESLALPPLRESDSPHPWKRPPSTALKPRFDELAFRAPAWPWPSQAVSPTIGEELELIGPPRDVAFGRSAIGTRLYWQSLVDAFLDGRLEEHEITKLSAISAQYALGLDDIRALHARIFAEHMLQLAKDDAVTDAEAANMADLHVALGRLGWAPGTTPAPAT